MLLNERGRKDIESLSLWYRRYCRCRDQSTKRRCSTHCRAWQASLSFFLHKLEKAVTKIDVVRKTKRRYVPAFIADALRLVVDHSAYTIAAAGVAHNVALGARAASYWTSLLSNDCTTRAGIYRGTGKCRLCGCMCRRERCTPLR